MKSEQHRRDKAEKRKASKVSLSTHVSESLNTYFDNMNGHNPHDLYDMVLRQVEGPLFEATLKYTEGNQSRAADMLGLTRTTLRKKLKLYNIKP